LPMMGVFSKTSVAEESKFRQPSGAHGPQPNWIYLESFIEKS
jgi:hypothetical protein